ncbi:MAG TPA: alpha-glucan family phosphorylase [Candidatus Dormibacteraeota bacterium]|nr:alpha-glucan family phosphorylase [Candidatus Dormibacteraeota bacterium]
MSPPGRLPLVAYFSMEYGLHEEFHSYAGGLGVLAGDFMKSAGDLGLPVVGVGLRWGQGYTSQHIGADGYPHDEWHDEKTDGLIDTEVRVRVRVATREVECRVWRVGRYAIAPLYLLEPTDLRDQWITRRLYDPRPDCRLAQEMLLGIGGVRALRAMHLPIDLYHFNEGHAIFAGIEMIADRMEAGASFHEAWKAARGHIVFTTHTPVPAGNEVHPIADLRRLGAGCELVPSELTEIGGDPFNMTVAGLRLASLANAVAKLHGETARAMWAHVEDAAPIIAITNGVHAGTWQDPRIVAAQGSDERLQSAKRAMKREMLAEVQARTGTRFDPAALTIGFARRAATYKRPDLLLRDPVRFANLLKRHKVQLLFAGKAHPADHEGKAVIARLVAAIRPWSDRVAFLEDYDMGLGRRLTRGCDVWLNTPSRPMEASGTSGMKAAMNGTLNLSVLDGWWPEGYEPGVTGWAIGDGTTTGDPDVRDLRSLYDTLEGEVLPAFADRGRWTAMMRGSIRMAAEHFSSDRMVKEYFARLYEPIFLEQ